MQLSANQLKLVQLVAQGLSNPEIAQILVINRKSVENHLSHIYDALGLSNQDGHPRVKLANWYREQYPMELLNSLKLELTRLHDEVQGW
jgi:DNA-binding NarL/FixJ family response regulator